MGRRWYGKRPEKQARRLWHAGGMSERRLEKFEVVSDERIGDGGFLVMRRLRLRSVYPDGERSEPYCVDYLERPKGVDAVVVVLYAGQGDDVHVLLREGMRPPLHFGRGPETTPLGEAVRPPWFKEVVAGIVEKGDVGEAGVRRRGAIEALEEAGYRVAPDELESLGAATFPSPGAMPECFYLYAAKVDRAAGVSPPGDGSPMEVGARLSWMPLLDAIAACTSGGIQDGKTEIALRRLACRLSLHDGGV